MIRLICRGKKLYTAQDRFAKEAYLFVQRQYYDVGGNHSWMISAGQERFVVPTILLIGYNTPRLQKIFHYKVAFPN